MPGNPQDTLGLCPIKWYNKARSTRLEALSWLRIVHKDGRSVIISTIPMYHKSELQDHIAIDICTVQFPQKPTSKVLPPPKITKATVKVFNDLYSAYGNTWTMSIHPPKASKSFSKHDFYDWSIIH